MPTQVQLRGANTATQSSRILAVRESDVDTTLKELRIHDGVMAGGMPHPNADSIQKNRYTYVELTGTNALSGDLLFEPSGMQAGMEFMIKVQNVNTGAVTINLNSSGAENLKKYTSGGSIPLNPGDLIADGVYPILFDGTDFILYGRSSGGIELVSTTIISGTPSTLDFSGVFDVGYSYIVELENIEITNATTLRAQLEQGGVYTASGYVYAGDEVSNGATNIRVDSNTNGTGHITLAVSIGSTTAGHAISGVVDFFNPNQSNFYKQGQSRLNYHDNGGTWTGLNISFCQNSSLQSVTGFRLLPSSGNFLDGGKVHIYKVIR